MSQAFSSMEKTILKIEGEVMILSDVCELIVDCPHSTAKDEGSGYPLIRTPNVGRGRLKLDDVHRVSYETYCRRNERATPKTDDLILAREAPVGNVALIKGGQQVCLGQRTVLIRPNKKLVEPEFLVYYLLSPEMQHVLRNSANGATVSHLNMADIRKLEISLPDLGIQKKIGKILTVIDDKIENNKEINDNLFNQATAIYKAWFCDYALSNGIRPASWKDTTIDELCSLVTRGITPKYDDDNDQIVLNQKCIRDHSIDLSLARKHRPKKINEKWIKKGDLLINSTGTGTLGRAAQVWFDTTNMTVDSHITIVRPKELMLHSYIGFWGISHECEIEAQHTGSTGQTELPRDSVKAMEIPLPDSETLIKFNEIILPMTIAIVANQEENSRLSQLRDSLLPKLMSGELDVSNIDI